MDKAYKGDIPRHKATLIALKREFSRIRSATDWGMLRIEPLLEHVSSLERLLTSPKFSREIERLRTGVAMFHSDLVYLRTNITVLKRILAEEKRRRPKTNGPNKPPGPTRPAVTPRAAERRAK